MSHHHILPPLIYVPQPKPKKIESRKSRVQLRSAATVKASDGTEETEETSAFAATRPASGQTPVDHFVPIEGAERKPRSTTGRLSDETLKALLQVQEQPK